MPEDTETLDDVSYLPNRTSERADDLMLAALDLFSKRDVSRVTIKDVAAVANVNSALIYYYFDDKDHLFRAALAFAIRKALTEYRELYEGQNDPSHVLSAYFRHTLELATPIRQLVKIMLDYSADTDRASTIQDLIDEYYRVERDCILIYNIQRGIDMGVFNKVDPARLAHFISVYLDGLMVASAIRTGFDLEEGMRDLEDMVWNRLGLPAPGGGR